MTPFSRSYRRYVLAVLTGVYTLNFLDGNLIILLLQPIKIDLQLSDSELGFLSGLAFALFYATLGVPIARWADRGDRSAITSLAIGLWGITAMLTVCVTSFAQMICVRIAAAVGEAGCVPPTYSLLADYYPGRGERTRAMAVYMMAVPLSALVSFIVGGYWAEHFGWRKTFLLAGLPGLLAAVLVKMTVAEPRRRAIAGSRSSPEVPPIKQVLTTLWTQSSCRQLMFAVILLLTMGNGLGSWYGAFMMRSHGMSTAEVGMWLGIVFGVGGILGNLCGGYLYGRLLAHSESAQMRLTAITVAALFPCFVVFLLVPQRGAAAAALVPLVIAFNSVYGPTYSLIQRLVPDGMRATAMAFIMLLANLIGMGIGPQVVGSVSDLLSPEVGDDSLRYAMLGMSFLSLWSAWHYRCVARTVD